MKKLIIIPFILITILAFNQADGLRQTVAGDTVPDFIQRFNNNFDAIMGEGTSQKPFWQIYNEWSTAHRLSVVMKDAERTNNFVMCLSPDLHSYYDGLDRLASFMGRTTAFDTVVKLWVTAGDNVYESAGIDTTDFFDLYQPLINRIGTYDVPLVYVLGNHDGNYFFTNHADSSLTKDQQRRKIMNPLYENETRITFNTPSEEDDSDGCYYFVDSHHNKIRTIFNDNTDVPEIVQGDTFKYSQNDVQAFSAEQLQWMVDTALQLPDSTWHVIVISHYRIEYKVTFDSSLYNMYRLLVDFKAQGSGNIKSISDNDYDIDYDFSTINGFDGVLVGIFYGHTHISHEYLSSGIWNICTPSITPTSTYNARDTGTTTEDAADFLVIRKDKRVFYMIRYGAGGSILTDDVGGDYGDINGDRGLNGGLTY